MGSAAVNGQLWGANAEAWSTIQEDQVVPLYEAVFDSTGIGPGTVLLDAGCGSGLALQLAAKRGATVSGIDASAALLDIARDRAPEADLRQGDLEDLPYPDKTFDVVTSFNAVQYAADPGRALAQLARVLRGGGTVAVATWGSPETNQITAVLSEIGPLMPPPPSGAPHSGPFSLSGTGALEGFVRAAGLVPSAPVDVACPLTYPDLQTAITGQASPGVLEMAARHSGREALYRALERSLRPFVRADGSVRIDSTFRYVTSRAAQAGPIRDTPTGPTGHNPRRTP